MGPDFRKAHGLFVSVMLATSAIAIYIPNPVADISSESKAWVGKSTGNSPSCSYQSSGIIGPRHASISPGSDNNTSGNAALAAAPIPVPSGTTIAQAQKRCGGKDLSCCQQSSESTTDATPTDTSSSGLLSGLLGERHVARSGLGSLSGCSKMSVGIGTSSL